MADCECLIGCAFFNDKMANMPATANIVKKTYCKGNSSNCARHMVFKALGKAKVPSDLYPNMTERVRELSQKVRVADIFPDSISK
jgi:hypothetical protein